MKTLLAFIVLAAVAVTAAAADLGPRAPRKPIFHTVPPPADPEALRQGGDTIADAVPLTLPVLELPGTTVGYTHDYDEMCPYGGSTSPDVVYSFVADYDEVLEVDLCGSGYDTKVYVYDQNLDLVACNDDFYPPGHPCGDYVSKIESLPVAAGVMYFVVVDGYGGDAGEYLLTIGIPQQCWLECPDGAELEGEPPLAEGYVDLHNGGCNTDEAAPVFQPLAAPLFCGVSGWYPGPGGLDSRDTDWFLLQIPAGGVLEVTGDATQESRLMELGPQDCAEVGVQQSVIMGPCLPNTLTITGEPGATVWLWVGPTVFSPPGPVDVWEYPYVLETNLQPVATRVRSLTAVKQLFR